MNRLRQVLIRLKRHNRILKKTKCILQNGIYSARENRISRVDKVSAITIPLYFIVSKKNTKNQQLNCTGFAYACGGDKDVVILDENAISFFRVKGQYDRAKLNYKNIDRFIYPCCEYYEFDDNSLSINMQKINGVVYSDEYHQKIVYRNLFTYAINSEFEITSSGKPKYVQHMDVRDCNIVWVDDSMTFIDLDGIAPATILFDVLQYSYDLGKTFDELLNVISDNHDLYAEVLEKYKFYLDNSNPLDTILFDYVEYYNSISSKHWRALEFLICDAIYEYPKTKNLLIDMRLLNI